MSFTGDVIAVSSHWTADGSRIVTEAVVSAAAGSVTVSQLGGTVDELTMRTFPSSPILEVGMRVALDTHEAPDLSAKMHILVDNVSVLNAGFVRTGLTKGGHSLYWESGCVFVSVAAEGTKEINGDLEFGLVDQAIAEWNDRTASCSYLTVMNDGQKTGVEVGGHDSLNLIKFRDTSWCRPAVGDDAARCYAMAAAGITTATYVDSKTNARDGAIVDADIELNAVNFDIGNDGMTLGTTGCIADLRNTLTHELGHLHGLEHTCLAATDPARVDNKGNPVPLCDSITSSGATCGTGDTCAASTEGCDTTLPTHLCVDKRTLSTMYNYQDCGETKKASLSQDDIDAICTIYTIAKDPGTCAPLDPIGGCCGTSEHPEAALLVAGGVALMLTRRRRR